MNHIRYPRWHGPRLLAAIAGLAGLQAAGAAESVPHVVEPASPASQPEVVLDEVLVVGERPGPAMWKVSKGDHTLYILGTLSPLPSKMTWRSRQVEDVIGRSGEVLAQSVTSARFGSSWAVIRNARALLRLRHNADGSTLREALAPEVYDRWHAAHRQWFGKDPDPGERARPLYAAELLFSQAMERSGLSNRSVVWPTVQQLARRNKVPIRRREFEVELGNPRGLIEELAGIPREREAACLVATLDYIDQQLPQMRRRANAWAVGDLAALRSLPAVDERGSCIMSLLEDTRLRKLGEEQAAAQRADWSGIVDWMLLQHETSFTTLPIEQLLDEQGVIARLRAKGYTVEVPQ